MKCKQITEFIVIMTLSGLQEHPPVSGSQFSSLTMEDNSR